MNNGNAVFTEVPSFIVNKEEAKGSRSFSLAAADFNADGWVDVYVTTFSQDNQLFLNDPCADGFAISKPRWRPRGQLKCGNTQGSNVSDTSGSRFATRDAATRACTAGCTGVADESCDGNGPWVLCTSSPLRWNESQSGSAMPCVFERTWDTNCCTYTRSTPFVFLSCYRCNRLFLICYYSCDA